MWIRHRKIQHLAVILLTSFAWCIWGLSPHASMGVHELSHHAEGQQRHRTLADDGPSEIDIDKRVRSQWRELTTACPRRNYSSCENADRSIWSDASKAKFSELSFKGIGKWSTFKMSTFSKIGGRRTRGGDSWFLLLRDYQQRLRVPVRIFDDSDGTYTGAVHFLHPGNYTLFGWLYYSDCNGLQVIHWALLLKL